MYNVNIKEEWLNTIQNEQEKRFSQSLLEKIAPHEEAVGKDFYEMSADEKVATVSAGEYKSLMRVRQICGPLNKYLAWRSFKDGKQISLADKVHPDHVSLKAVDEWEISDENFLYIVDKNAPHVDGSLVPVICALAWLGYKPQTMIALKNEDVAVRGAELYVENKLVADGLVKNILVYYATHDSFGGDKIKLPGAEFLRKVMLPHSTRSREALTTVNINSLISRYNNVFSPKVNLRDLSKLGGYQRASEYLKAHPEEKEIPLAWALENTSCKLPRAAQDFVKHHNAYRKTIEEE